jgi:hypothetical protein
MTGDKNSGKGAAMKDFRSALPPAAALASLLALAACGGGHPPAAKANDGAAPQPPTSTSATPDLTSFCPQTALLQQAQTVTLFKPGRSDVASQISTAQITGISGACTPKTKDKQKLLEVKFTANFLANNGPANHGQPVTLPWFVAITKGDKIIDKKIYYVTLKFNGNMSTAAATSKPVKIEVPAVPDSAGLEILTGFQMTQNQLAYAAAHPDATP